MPILHRPGVVVAFPVPAAGGTVVSEPVSERITNSDIDRRVGHLEEVQSQHGDRLHELGNEINVVKLQVEHSQILMRAKFEQVIATQGKSDEKLDRLIERLDRENQGFTELTASPAGRFVATRLDDLEKGRQAHSAAIRRIEDRVLQAAAVIAFVAFGAPLLAPFIQGWLSLPK